MKTLFLGLAAAVAMTLSSGTVMAQCHKVSYSSGHYHSHVPYYAPQPCYTPSYVHQPICGYKTFHCSQGSYHCQYYPSTYKSWAHSCWFPQHGCHGYYCPTACSWFFYCAPQQCYLPVQYISQFAPQTVNVNLNTNQNVNQNTNVNNNINNNVNGVPALPTGAIAVPGGIASSGFPGGAPGLQQFVQ